jgi:hypothetical protein
MAPTLPLPRFLLVPPAAALRAWYALGFGSPSRKLARLFAGRMPPGVLVAGEEDLLVHLATHLATVLPDHELSPPALAQFHALLGHGTLPSKVHADLLAAIGRLAATGAGVASWLQLAAVADFSNPKVARYVAAFMRAWPKAPPAGLEQAIERLMCVMAAPVFTFSPKPASAMGQRAPAGYKTLELVECSQVNAHVLYSFPLLQDLMELVGSPPPSGVTSGLRVVRQRLVRATQSGAFQMYALGFESRGAAERVAHWLQVYLTRQALLSNAVAHPCQGRLEGSRL